MDLHLLFVEDSEEEYAQIHRQITEYFDDKDDLSVTIDGKSSFEEALSAVENPHIRYDLIISDTYKGEHKEKDAAVMKMIDDYRKNDKFCPLIVCSSGVCPADLESSAFINWVGKEKPGDLDIAITEILELGIPQLARSLHDEIDSVAGNFLWGFLEKNLDALQKENGFNSYLLDRLIRSRAAMVLNDLAPGGVTYSSIDNRHGLEYYIYPNLEHKFYNLGDIILNDDDDNDIRVILTPHCHLYIREGKEEPKADHVLTVKTIKAEDVLGGELGKISDKFKANGLDAVTGKLSSWARSPSNTGSTPKGRHWYLPHFLSIPHLFCDFLQIESIDYKTFTDKYSCIATLTPPYAEAMQQSFASFYGSVGIPDIDPKSIVDILN
jgi:hypothetical protein